jgi:hypothetical protein
MLQLVVEKSGDWELVQFSESLFVFCMHHKWNRNVAARFHFCQEDKYANSRTCKGYCFR